MKQLSISTPQGKPLDIFTIEEFDYIYEDIAQACFESLYVDHVPYYSEEYGFVVEEVQVH